MGSSLPVSLCICLRHLWSLSPRGPRSFIEISNCTLSKVQAEDGIKAMMQAAGFERKEKITWEDFHLLLRDHQKELQFAQLNVKGHQSSQPVESSFICIRIHLLNCFLLELIA